MFAYYDEDLARQMRIAQGCGSKKDWEDEYGKHTSHKKCNRCGKENNRDSNYCSKCGKKLD